MVSCVVWVLFSSVGSLFISLVLCIMGMLFSVKV